MKKYSDYFSGLKRLLNKVGNRIATTALFMVAASTMAFAQDFTFIEGSVHGFKVENHEGNKFEWSMKDHAFNPMDPLAFTFMEGQFDTNVTLRFNDMNRTTGEFVYLAVTETNPHGCSTTRAINILLEPNNMYLEFASTNTQDCYNLIGNYPAPLKIGLNFKNKAAGDSIPASFFPLTLTYTVRDRDTSDTIKGNRGEPVKIAFSPTNDYYLMIPEAVGSPSKTIEYELVITSVKDKFDTDITKNDEFYHLQIRIINHLPQSNSMEMALAYYIVNP